MPKLLNKRFDFPTPGCVDIMRPGIWGNPFEVGKGYTREQAIAKHRSWMHSNKERLARLGELEGRDLMCCCAPKPCHGQNLLDLLADRALGIGVFDPDPAEREKAALAALFRYTPAGK
jgi:hypothetical protein